MKAIMLAAGIGARLTGDDEDGLPKSLLRFGGKTLLERSIDNLRRLEIERLILVVGYRAEDIVAECERLGCGGFVEFVVNDDYRSGSVVSLWTARETLAAGGEVMCMDADVLYHPSLLKRLVHYPAADCFLFDREFEDGEEPVKLCLAGGRPVEFRKRVEVAYDEAGEWPGFLKFSAGMALEAARQAQGYVDRGATDQPCEEVYRDLLLARPEAFAIADVTGIPWIEIDFPGDVVRARDEVLPQIEAYAG